MEGPTSQSGAAIDLSASLPATPNRSAGTWTSSLKTIEDWRRVREEFCFSRHFRERKPTAEEKKFYNAAWKFCNKRAQRMPHRTDEVRAELMTQIYCDTPSTLDEWLAQWATLQKAKCTRYKLRLFRKSYSNWASKQVSCLPHCADRQDAYNEYMRKLSPAGWAAYPPVSLHGWEKAYKERPEWSGNDADTLREHDQNFRLFYRTFQEWARKACNNSPSRYTHIMGTFLIFKRTPFLKLSKEDDA